MNLLYIVGDGSKNDNAELRWSLRSVAKFGRGIDRVIVAGIPPAWLSDEVETIEIAPVDIPGRNHTISNNVLEGVLKANLEGDFILGIDDVFFIDPVDFDVYPRFVDSYDLPGPVTDGSKANGWISAMAETRQFCRDHKLPSVNFMTHAFCRLDADVVRKNADLIRQSIFETTRGLEIVSLVGNLTLKERPYLQLVRRKDVKFGADDFTGHFDSRYYGQFSISDKTFGNGDFHAFMTANFSEACRYERGAAKERGVIAALRRAFACP